MVGLHGSRTTSVISGEMFGCLRDLLINELPVSWQCYQYGEQFRTAYYTCMSLPTATTTGTTTAAAKNTTTNKSTAATVLLK